ncbi:MAG: CPBP family intramembrane metalloprotease [Oscillospiraceae bacterium]|nr:CPBP family intramembrane metalloprotease [Oscillospiraceae bacterium]
MRKYSSAGPYPNNQETICGFCYLAVQLLFLPGLLTWVNGQLSHSLNDAELNFVYYLVNFIAMLLIFHDFLSRSLQQAFQHPILLCEAVILGFVAYYACFHITDYLVSLLVPSFSNYNDEAIFAMRGSNFFLMTIGTVILVPPFEECIFRGLIFRNLYGKSRWAAYLVSMVAFACIHILGYIGAYSPLELVLAVLQYLPAGLCLAWSYTRSDTIFAPILIHAAVNYITITGIR